MPALAGRQKLDLEILARRIIKAFKAIGETAENEAADVTLYNQLVESTNVLPELIAEANAALDRVVKQPR